MSHKREHWLHQRPLLHRHLIQKQLGLRIQEKSLLVEPNQHRLLRQLHHLQLDHAVCLVREHQLEASLQVERLSLLEQPRTLFRQLKQIRRQLH